MRIVLDAMGSDDHPEPEMQAALEAFRLWGEPVLLAGPEPQLQELLERLGGSRGQVQIAHAPEVLEMTDKAAGAARGKPNSSMAVGMEQLRIGEAQAFVTAGNTGGAMATALFKLGRIRGVRRPALSPTFPVRGGRTVVIDIGANTECRPEFLVQFAQMGVLYSQVMYGVANPRVGLLSNGEEAGKGNLLVRETFPLFQGLGLNFVGNLEPKEVYQGAADVVVTDGFTGNVFLKTSEAVASMLVDTLREEIRSTPVGTIGGLLARPAFGKVRRLMDPSEYGAVPLLGIDGLVFIGHGRSNAKALMSALTVARQAVEADLLMAMRNLLGKTLKSRAEVGA
jgi:glycerol-3-phosphate acyltransferase PlsX